MCIRDSYVTSNAGVEVYAASGTLWQTVEVPEKPANVTLGGANGRTLFITAQTSIYQVVLDFPS